jgi:hypothetical protein
VIPVPDRSGPIRPFSAPLSYILVTREDAEAVGHAHFGRPEIQSARDPNGAEQLNGLAELIQFAASWLRGEPRRDVFASGVALSMDHLGFLG